MKLGDGVRGRVGGGGRGVCKEPEIMHKEGYSAGYLVTYKIDLGKHWSEMN